MENGWADPRINLATFAGFAVMILCFVITHRKVKTRERIKKIAIEKGNVMKAKCVSVYKSYKKNDSGKRETTYHGRYEYTVNGKTKHYSIHNEYGVPRDYLELYYKDSPSKVISDYDYVGRVGAGIAILLGIAACILTLYLTGYFANPELYE